MSAFFHNIFIYPTYVYAPMYTYTPNLGAKVQKNYQLHKFFGKKLK